MPESLSFDRVADRYDASRGYPQEVAERIAEALAEAGHLTVGSEALEIGIGTGRIAIPLLTRGVNVTGVDIAERMLERLDAKYAQMRAAGQERIFGRLTVRLADMAALPFKDASFDAVIAVHVFHLVPEWKRAIDEALRVTRAAGALLIGQDVHSGSDALRAGQIQDHWRAILREMGYTPRNVGAAGFDAVLAELRDRGHTVDEHTVATWETAHTAREALETITTRLWSGTWTVPDDIFAESVRRLTAWADGTYGARLDTPILAPHAFRLARVSPRPLAAPQA
jgi:ubiquinone/menaquinone biosynthesis C-methylase UbiE